MFSPHDAALVRRDPGIPGLAVLLDPEAFMDALRRAVPGLDVHEARTSYVRYKPGTNCLVTYTLNIGGREIQVYAKAYRGDAADHLRKAQERPGVPGPFGPGRLVLEEFATVVSAFPNDGALKSLGRVAEGRPASDLLRRVVRDRPDLWDGTLKTLVYKPERRYVAQLLVRGEPRAVLKLYTDANYTEAMAACRDLRSRGPLRVAQRVGRSNGLGILAFEWMPGRLLSEALADRHFDPRAVKTVGAALAEVHAQEPVRLSRLTREAEASILVATAESLGILCPDLAGRAAGLARRLADLLLSAPPVNHLIHGDFYAKQVLLDGDSAVILDFDSAALGDPAADLGLFVAHLERGAIRGNVPSDRVAGLRDALIDGYEAVTGHSAPDRLTAYTAAGLLQLAPHPFRNRQSDWPEQIDATLSRAEAILAGDIRAPGHIFGSTLKGNEHAVATVDPAMPFLKSALDRSDAERQLRTCLTDLTGRDGTLHLMAVRLARHKPGRRCLVEYDVEIERRGGPSELMTLVGKARARGLDRTTLATQQALREAGFGPGAADGISVPEPVGVIPEYRMWLQRKVAGVAATRLLPGPGGVELACRVAEATVKLHRTGIIPLRRHTMADELRILHERLPAVAAAEPRLESRLVRVLEAYDRIASRVPEAVPAGVHRDFYAEHVLVDGARLYLIDFDLFCAGDPGLDVGNFTGHLVEQGLRSQGDPEALADRIAALEDRFAELTGASVRRSIRVYHLLTLVRHIWLSTLFPDRRPFTEALLSLCERRLAGSGRRLTRPMPRLTTEGPRPDEAVLALRDVIPGA